MLEIPYEAVERPKRAVQYGSGVDKAIKMLAIKNGYKYIVAYLKAIFDRVFADSLR
jgi:hypothetical protein